MLVNYLLELKNNYLHRLQAVVLSRPMQLNVLRETCHGRDLKYKTSAGLLRCTCPPQCKLCTYNILPPHAVSMASCWRQNARFSLGSPHMLGLSLTHYGDKSQYCHGKMKPTEGVKTGMKTFCSLPWVWCYGPQLETCHTWAAQSVPTCQILSWCRDERICPSHL